MRFGGASRTGPFSEKKNVVNTIGSAMMERMTWLALKWKGAACAPGRGWEKSWRRTENRATRAVIINYDDEATCCWIMSGLIIEPVRTAIVVMLGLKRSAMAVPFVMKGEATQWISTPTCAGILTAPLSSGGRKPNERYTSFDYCYNYFQAFRESGEVSALATPTNIQVSCLQLGFYLASWGMLPGFGGIASEERKAPHPRCRSGRAN